MKALKKILLKTGEMEKITSSRLGSLVKIEPEKNLIWVDYQDNPLSKPLVAKLGTPWIALSELISFQEKVDRVLLAFIDGNPCKPVVKDLFFSLNEIKQSNTLPPEKRLVLNAEEIVLKGQKRVIIESGNARTTYSANGAQIIQEAEQIESTAESSNRVRGGSVLLN